MIIKGTRTSGTPVGVGMIGDHCRIQAQVKLRETRQV